MCLQIAALNLFWQHVERRHPTQINKPVDFFQMKVDQEGQ
jgi:hypothetical protein